MKKKRFGVEQIVGVLKQAEVGVPVVELIRKVGISEQTFYRWPFCALAPGSSWSARKLCGCVRKTSVDSSYAATAACVGSFFKNYAWSFSSFTIRSTRPCCVTGEL